MESRGTTAEFASERSRRGLRPSRDDDYASLCYTLHWCSGARWGEAGSPPSIAWMEQLDAAVRRVRQRWLVLDRYTMLIHAGMVTRTHRKKRTMKAFHFPDSLHCLQVLCVPCSNTCACFSGNFLPAFMFFFRSQRTPWRSLLPPLRERPPAQARSGSGSTPDKSGKQTQEQTFNVECVAATVVRHGRSPSTATLAPASRAVGY